MLSWKKPAKAQEGEMAEWLKAHAWKACLGETLTWVRIPLSPPLILLILKIVNSSFGRLRPAALSVVPPCKLSAVHAVGEAEALIITQLFAPSSRPAGRRRRAA